MKTKEITIPDGWEVKSISGNKITLQEFSFPKTFEECKQGMHTVDLDNYPCIRIVPVETTKCLTSFFKLLICRNAWWKKLGWKPDWEGGEVKYCISNYSNRIIMTNNYENNRILAFPKKEVCDQFLEAFRDLIEEAKELL